MMKFFALTFLTHQGCKPVGHYGNKGILYVGQGSELDAVIHAISRLSIINSSRGDSSVHKLVNDIWNPETWYTDPTAVVDEYNRWKGGNSIRQDARVAVDFVVDQIQVDLFAKNFIVNCTISPLKNITLDNGLLSLNSSRRFEGLSDIDFGVDDCDGSAYLSADTPYRPIAILLRQDIDDSTCPKWGMKMNIPVMDRLLNESGPSGSVDYKLVSMIQNRPMGIDGDYYFSAKYFNPSDRLWYRADGSVISVHEKGKPSIECNEYILIYAPE
jgi:hypothetical protein